MSFLAYFSKEVVQGVTNPQLLKEQAAAAFPGRFVNCDDGVISKDTRGLGIYLEGEITKDDEATWDAVILAHDGTQKTAEQLAADEAAQKKSSAEAYLKTIDRSTLDPTISNLIDILGY